MIAGLLPGQAFALKVRPDVVRDRVLDVVHLSLRQLIRRHAVDFSVCLLTDIKLAALVITALHRGKATSIKAWDQYGV